jgi:predicted ATPase with chaperone activity
VGSREILETRTGYRTCAIHIVTLSIQIPFLSIRARVQAARDIQNARFASNANGSSGIVCNADMHVGEIRYYRKLQDESDVLIGEAVCQRRYIIVS